MPSYKVKEKGFFNGKIYDPRGKRPVLHTEKPFEYDKSKKREKVPSWLERIKDETAAEAKARKAAEAKAAKADKDKAAADKQEVESASFLEGGEDGGTEIL